MKPGDWLVAGLAGFNLLVALVYALSGEWAKTLYWVGAAIINTSVVLMR